MYLFICFRQGKCIETANYGSYRDRQVAQLSQRYRAAGWVSYSQKWKADTRMKLIFLCGRGADFTKNSGQTTLEGGEGWSDDETIAKMLLVFRRWWLMSVSTYTRHFLEEKILWRHQLSHRVIPTLVTPLQMSAVRVGSGRKFLKGTTVDCINTQENNKLNKNTKILLKLPLFVKQNTSKLLCCSLCIAYFCVCVVFRRLQTYRPIY